MGESVGWCTRTRGDGGRVDAIARQRVLLLCYQCYDEHSCAYHKDPEGLPDSHAEVVAAVDAELGVKAGGVAWVTFDEHGAHHVAAFVGRHEAIHVVATPLQDRQTDRQTDQTDRQGRKDV